MSSERRTLLEKIEQLDPRVIYVVMVLAVAIPLINPIGIPITIEDRVQTVYNFIEELPEGSIVIVNYQMRTATWGELGLGSLPIMKHLWSRPLKLVFATFAEEAPAVVEDILKLTEKERSGKVYGEDYVVLPFIPGLVSAIAQFGDDVHSVVSQDYYGTPISELPLMDEVRNADDFDLILTMDHQSGMTSWVTQVYERYGTPIAMVCLSLEEMCWLPYYQANQIFGLMVGGKGGAQYELLIKEPGANIAGMDATSMGYIAFLSFIWLGNILYWTVQLRRRT